ncbi:hypothetical protein [Brachybacterium sp. YJGR34]|uniref:hypothetical protein n=1 Tax=Brachybacterium sp. YJGR34 TaxID=2059911 RepID=UPI0013001AB8|nr:hypothetical protein [Brachybacterium sp. YJGR34]
MAGPGSLFVEARAALAAWTMAGIDLTGRHVSRRLAEREIPAAAIVESDPQSWEIITVDVTADLREIGAMSIRREFSRGVWLWAVLGRGGLVTAWLREHAGIGYGSGAITRQGPAWLAVRDHFDARREKTLASAPRTPAGSEVPARLLGLERALATMPMSVTDRRRFHDAAALVRSGLSWRIAVDAAGWISYETGRTAVKRIVREQGSRAPIPVMPHDRWEEALTSIDDLERRLPHASVRETTRTRLTGTFDRVRRGHTWTSAARRAEFPSYAAMAAARRRVAATGTGDGDLEIPSPSRADKDRAAA